MIHRILSRWSCERVFPLLDKLIPNKLSRITPFLCKSYSDRRDRRFTREIPFIQTVAYRSLERKGVKVETFLSQMMKQGLSRVLSFLLETGMNKGHAIRAVVSFQHNYLSNKSCSVQNQLKLYLLWIFYVLQDLPKPPIPNLHLTLERYLKGLKPVLPSAQYQQTEKTVEDFLDESGGGEGPGLQRELEEYASKIDNWVSFQSLSVDASLAWCSGGIPRGVHSLLTLQGLAFPSLLPTFLLFLNLFSNSDQDPLQSKRNDEK